VPSRRRAWLPSAAPSVATARAQVAGADVPGDVLLQEGDGAPAAGEPILRVHDLVKEFTIALVVMTGLSLVLAAVFSSPDDPAITLAGWAKADSADVVATATGELAGTTTSATYGAPYNDASEGQSVLGLKLQKWGGARLALSSADLVLQPLHGVSGDPALTDAHAASVGRDGACTAS